MAKENKNITILSHRFDPFEIRLSESKVEVEDRVHKQRKFVYSSNTPEYNTFLVFLSELKHTDEGVVEKSHNEGKADLKTAEFLAYLLYNTQLIFTDAEFRDNYVNNMLAVTEREVKVKEPDESEEETLANLKAEHEAKEILKKE